MARRKESPYICHLFVCTNDRHGKRKSCADYRSPEFRKALKEEIGKRGWKGRVRVSQCGCMGLCDKGPNTIIYPQRIWFTEVSTDDINDILAVVEKTLNESD